ARFGAGRAGRHRLALVVRHGARDVAHLLVEMQHDPSGRRRDDGDSGRIGREQVGVGLSGRREGGREQERGEEGCAPQRRLLKLIASAAAARPRAATLRPRTSVSPLDTADSLATSTTGVFHTVAVPSAKVCTPTRCSVVSLDPTEAEKRKSPRSSGATEPPCQLIATIRWDWSRTSCVLKPGVEAAPYTSLSSGTVRRRPVSACSLSLGESTV